MKNKSIKYLKKIFITIYFVLFTALSLFQVFLFVSNSSYSLSSYLYWFVLVGWIYKIREHRLTSASAFKVAFVLFIFAAMFAFLNLDKIGETVMRVSFIGWIIGFIQAIIEYRKENGGYVKK